MLILWTHRSEKCANSPELVWMWCTNISDTSDTWILGYYLFTYMRSHTCCWCTWCTWGLPDLDEIDLDLSLIWNLSVNWACQQFWNHVRKLESYDVYVTDHIMCMSPPAFLQVMQAISIFEDGTLIASSMRQWLQFWNKEWSWCLWPLPSMNYKRQTWEQTEAMMYNKSSGWWL